MRLVDLSRTLYHQEPSGAGSVPPQVWVWHSHEGTRPRYSTDYSFTNRLLTFHDHTSTHVDAPRHFDPDPDALDIASVPLEWCYGPAICLDVSTARDPRWIDASDLDAACSAHGLTVEAGDIVLLASGHHRRTYPRPEYFNAYPGLTTDAVRWLHARGVRNFGVETPNPGHPEDHEFAVHLLCRQLGMIHMEGLANLELVAGKRFTFIGFPLKIRDGSGSPIRAVACLAE